MCGIAGIVRSYPPGQPVPHPLESIPERWLDILDESIKHRGPDGQGRFRDRTLRDDGTTIDVALVHRRLSIIDHADGHQPMVHDSDRLRPDLTYQPGDEPILAHERAPDLPLVAVVFNGCIYNHRELRKKLEAAGHRFGTDHSDTEVLVHGWREWGLEQVEQLDGMYAVLTWDRATGQIASGRDLAGEKPLYHSVVHRLQVWCSCISGLTNARLLVRPEQDHHVECGMEATLRFGMGSAWSFDTSEQTPSRWTRFPDDSLSCSHSLTSSTGSWIEQIRQRPLPERSSNQKLTTDQVTELLDRAVASRLEADAPKGLFLSGGIDSGILAALARNHDSDMATFCVRMPHAAFDESEAASTTAAHLGLRHTTLDFDASPATDLIELIERLGLPFGDSSLLPTLWLCRAARTHVKVAISGDGGDELFGGYHRHVVSPVLTRWRWVIRLIPSSALDQRDPKSPASYLARLGVAARGCGYDELRSIFPTPDLRRVSSVNELEEDDRNFQRVTDPLRYDFRSYLPDDLLRKTDTASMSVALEVRAPFLAREVVDACLAAPLDNLMPGGKRKGLLKQVARKYLPDHIIDRPKQGFAIPIGEWFRTDFGGMRQLLYDHLESADPFPGLADAGVNINMGFVRTMLRQHDAAGEKSINPWHGRDHSQRLYMLLVLSIWAKWLERIRRNAEP